MKVTKEENVSARGRRFSVQRKMAVVARLLRGEPLELVARETNVTIQKLTEWRDRALAGATSALKERERDDRDDEIARLKAKVGEITMDNELLYAICARPRMASVFLALRTIWSTAVICPACLRGDMSAGPDEVRRRGSLSRSRALRLVA